MMTQLEKLEQAAKAPLGPLTDPAKVENTIHATPSPYPGGSHESYFDPKSVSQILAEPPEEVEWVLDEYLPRAGLVLLAGKPKGGKSTLSYELAVCVAQGLSFLGRQTRQGAVLILAMEEHGRDATARLRNLGAADLPNMFIHVGSFEPTATALASITSFAIDRGVTLILVDTLSAFWRIDNENDAAEMTKVVRPLLQLARESGACVLLIHHARKSEGSYGDEIRGSGALFAAVDVALILKRHEVQTQRLLQAQSRYPETPSELVVELRESGYVALGDPASTGKTARLATLTGSLCAQWQEVEPLAKQAGLSLRETHRLLGLLVAGGQALRDGKGRKGSPYRYKNTIHATPPPKGAGLHESNSTSPNTIHATPPSPCMNGIQGSTVKEAATSETQGLFAEEALHDEN